MHGVYTCERFKGRSLARNREMEVRLASQG